MSFSFLAKVNLPLSHVPVMSVRLLLCCLLWLFNSILFCLVCVIKMFSIFDVECASSPSLESLSYSFVTNALFLQTLVPFSYGLLRNILFFHNHFCHPAVMHGCRDAVSNPWFELQLQKALLKHCKLLRHEYKSGYRT